MMTTKNGAAMTDITKYARIVGSWMKVTKAVEVTKVTTDGFTYVVETKLGPAMICGKETMDAILLEQYKITECPVKHVEHERD